MSIVAPDPNLAATAKAVADDLAAGGSIVKNVKTRGKIYAVMALAGLAVTVANGVVAYLATQHVGLGSVPVVLGAVDVAFPIVSGAVHGLSKANT